MERIWNAIQTKEADRKTMEAGTPSLVLMEKAAKAVVAVLKEQDWDLSRPLLLVGTGNNGGDGLAIARLLAEEGAMPQILAWGDPSRYSEERAQQEAMLPDGIRVVHSLEEVTFSDRTIVIDALFGIGLHRPLQEEFATLFAKVEACGTPVVAVDMPSGIHTDTGEVLGCALRATRTVTFSTLKPGLLLYPGKTYAGEVDVREIGISCPEEELVPPALFRVRADDRSLLPPRPEDGNKGTFGKVLVIAGSRQICGAAYLAGKAALMSGAGMVRIYTEEHNYVPLAASFPEALLDTYTEAQWEAETLQNALAWADVVLIGPGIGQSRTAAQILEHVLNNAEHPLVLDADAINLLAKTPERLRSYQVPCVLTPHILEMSRLTGKSADEILQDRVGAARSLAQRLQATIVLKDATTVIAEPEDTIYLFDEGSSALATAGSGDVLAGLLAGLLAQYRRENSLPLPAIGVSIHGACGMKMAEIKSPATVLASDLLAAFPAFL